MSLSLVIAINVLADAALIGLLAYAMSRAARLTPHLSAGEQQLPAIERDARPRRLVHRHDTRPRTPIARRAGAEAATAHQS